MPGVRQLQVTLVVFCFWIQAAATQNDEDANPFAQQMTELQNYLERNGYLMESDNITDPSRNMTQAIIDLQTLSGLQPTGEVDGLLLSIIGSRRCGLADIMPETYQTANVKFGKNHLTYWIEQFPPSMDQQVVKAVIRDAFQVWADVTPLSFSEVFVQDADIQILFGAREHGDGVPFDGRGGVLAHAYLPLSGDAHFDAEERWTVGTFAGTNLFQVAAHEFGHSLGLLHSQDITALMYPYYRGYQPNFRLSEDDKEGIRSLYGRERVPDYDGTDEEPDSGNNDDVEITTASTPTPPPPTTPGTPTQAPPPPAEACLRNGTFDAVVNTKDGHSFGFIGAYVWRLDVFPRTFTQISEAWQSLPNHVQSAVKQGDITYILKGCYVWRYENLQYRGRRRIREQWPGLPCNVQAGYVSSSDTYFFKGLFVYRFHGSSFRSRRRIWSLNWHGLPYRNFRITAISPNLNDDGEVTNVYIFTGNVYYLFDDATKRFVYRNEYPREVTRFILGGCLIS